MIFVSIASFRDKELIRTVKSCLSNAKYPNNIKIGICWQYDDDEDTSLLDNIPQLHIYKIYWKNVEGSVCWARHLVQEKFFKDEEYYFQIDSHTLFVKDWDEILVNMYKELPTNKAVISVGPPYYYDLTSEAALAPVEYDQNITEINGIKYETVIKKQKVDAEAGGGTHFMYGFLPAEDISKPIPARHISAALLFTIGKWVKEVPYDPNLYFSGEEATLTLRSYTNGYDIFNPNKFVVYHLKYRFEYRKRHWNTFDAIIVDKQASTSNKRYKQIVNGENLGIFGIGNIRSILEWEIYSGVSFTHGIAHPKAKQGLIPDPITITDLDEWERMKNKTI